MEISAGPYNSSVRLTQSLGYSLAPPRLYNQPATNLVDQDGWLRINYLYLCKGQQNTLHAKIFQMTQYITRSTQRAQTSLAEADHYSHIAHCKNVEPWL